MIDAALRRLTSRALRMGLDGQSVWLAVAGAAWLVRRSRRTASPVVWSGTLKPGDRLLVTSHGADAVISADDA